MHPPQSEISAVVSRMPCVARGLHRLQRPRHGIATLDVIAAARAGPAV